MGQSEVGQAHRGNLDHLSEYLLSERGLDLSRYRRQYLERRLATRLRALGLHSYRQYSDHIECHPEEFARLLAALTISVTKFFRDPAVYEIVRSEILPNLVSEKLASQNRMLRIWSAGCATGEEPYSMAMSALEAIGSHSAALQLTVLATDLDEGVLSHARTAAYPLEELDCIPESLQLEYVDKHDKTFTIKPEVTSRVKFRKLDLFSEEALSVSDMIVCRNVFIYFDREHQERALESFWSSLTRGGYLILGRSEKLAPSMAHRFEAVSGRERIYRKLRYF